MDNILEALLSWQFLLFCLACAAVTFVFRHVIEYFLENPIVPTSKNSKIWTDLILPIFPVLFGCIGAVLATEYPFPEGLNAVSGRLVFGLVAGLLSGLSYRLVKSFIISKFGVSHSNEEEAAADKVRKSMRDE